MEDLLTLHRKQLRDLQSVITQKKKSATKKTRRGVNDDCERLERELKEKQALEITALEEELNPTSTVEENDGSSEPVVGDNPPPPEEPEQKEDISTKLQETTLEDPTTPTNHERIQLSTSSKKPNRAKARLARRAAQIEEITAQAHQEAASQPNLRAIEAERMKQLFEENGLVEIQIAPDGHCLYSAFAVGLEGAGISLSEEAKTSEENGEGGTKMRGYTFTRKAAGAYISSHPDDFIPFLEEGETLDGHVRKVTSTAEWGGQMELLALAKEYGVTVKVVQAQGVGVTAMNEEEGEKADVWLAYHRKGYGLGEHYNALRKK
ncbi:hypothetical protein TWF506_003920 [Arthrobotrys conoides]|uniref:OTU domain-containing protein n=1 Tax=Arthrobotrys conoides TaxID=74498 RepID=A0AAN8NG27_9PEZI